MADAAAVSLGLDEDDQNAAERVAAHLRQCGWSAEALPELVRRHDLGVVHVTDIEPEEFILVSTAPAAVTHRRMRRYYRLPLEGRMNVMTSVLTAAEVEGVLGALDPHAPIVRAFELVGTHLREEADYGPSVFVAHTLDVKRAPIGEDAFDRLLDVHTYAVERFPYADALSSIVPVEVTLDDGRTMVGRMVTLMVPGVGGFVITSVPFGDRLLLRWIDREALPETIDLTALERALGRGLADLDLEGVNAFFGGRETPQPAAGRDLAAQRRLAALGLVALFQMIAAESADPTAAELAFRLGLAGATDPVLRMLIDEIERDPSAVDDLVDEAARRRASLSLLGMIEASPCPLDVKRAVVDVFGFATAQQVAILHTFLGVD